MRWIYVTLLCIYVAQLTTSTESPVAETKLGKYQGHYKTTLNGRQVAAFNGIRYAKPPTNNLRFKDAEKIEAHEGLYDATKDGDDCLQVYSDYNKYPEEEIAGMQYVGSEDCLFLNVYTPNLKPEKPYPVLVYIHGGSYIIGTSASNLHGPELLLDKDIILVALNYRLGVFGFLSVDDEILPGNLGLKDQSLAIHWVKDNIASFGGDPESITLVGHSAGASSAHFQMISPLNKGILQRAISQSGTADCSWSFISANEARDFSSKLATSLNCPQTAGPLLACLKEKTWEKIMNSVSTFLADRSYKIAPFAPIFENNEGGFMTEKDLAEGSSIPWMSGVTKDDGLIMYREIYGKLNKDLQNFNTNYKVYLAEVFNYYTHPQAEKISNLIKLNYFGNEDISNKNAKQFVNMLSDGSLFYGHLVSARKHKGNTYFYLITHEGQNSLATGLPVSGVCHADELFYLFPFSKAPKKIQFNEEDSKMQKLMVDLWTNFIIHGDPTPGKKEPKWYESEKGKLYVTISNDGIKLAKSFYSTRMNFWDNISKNFFSNDIRIKDEL